MRKSFLTFLFLLLTIPAYAQLTFTQPIPPPPPPTITVTGEGYTTIRPTRATVLLSITSKGSTSLQAQTLLNARTVATFTALQKAGLPDDALTTTSYNLYEDFRYDKKGARTSTGWSATHSLTLRVTNLDKLSDWVNLAIKAGAPTISSVSFDTPNRADAEHLAIRMAIDHAMLNADVMAAGTHTKLGEVIKILPYLRNPSALRVSLVSASGTPITLASDSYVTSFGGSGGTSTSYGVTYAEDSADTDTSGPITIQGISSATPLTVNGVGNLRTTYTETDNPVSTPTFPTFAWGSQDVTASVSIEIKIKSDYIGP